MHYSRLFRLLALAAIALIALIITGCGGDDGTDGSAAQTGTLSLAVTDAPIDSATKVVIVFTGVEVHGPGGTTTFEFDSPKRINLLKYQNANAAVLLDDQTLKAGEYQWIRLDIAFSKSFIKLDDGGRYGLTIPSGAQSGLKLTSGFTVPAGGSADFTIDFDLRKSIHASGKGSTTFKLTPALKLVNNVEVGKIKGSVTHTLKIEGRSIDDPECGPAVYLYTGTNVTPGDVNTTNDTGDQPIESTELTLNGMTGIYDFAFGFVSPGYYTLAVTCGELDEPDVADTLHFAATTTVSVKANEIKTVSLP